MKNDTRIKLGVVGIRNIGMGHVRRALDLDNVQITAIADREEKRLESAVETIGDDVQCFSDADPLFESDVDAVVLAVPNNLHAPMSIAAMKAGKDVLVEKPMAMNPAEAEQMLNARDETGKTLMVGMNQRFNPFNEAARKKIASGELGRVYCTKTSWVQNRPGEGLWGRGDWFLTASESGGGPLIDLGVHRLDLAMHLLGWPEPVTVTGYSSTGIGERVARERGRAYELEDYAAGMIQFADGSSMFLESSYFHNSRVGGCKTDICGLNGNIAVDNGVTHTVWKDEEPVTVDLEPDPECATSCVEHFSRALRGEEDLISTPEQGLKGLQIIDAIYTSAESGEPVSL